MEPKAKAKAKAMSKAAAEVVDSGEEKRKDPTDGKAILSKQAIGNE